jgi:hypothetical protein
MTTLDDIINRSWQDEQDRLNNRKILTNENNNVIKLFKEVQLIKTECNICYDNKTDCIQCYQCDFKYCKDCLIKIISEFNKCSACQVDFKNNYTKLKHKNKIKNNQISNITKNTNASAATNKYENLLMSDYEIEQISVLLQIKNLNLDSNSSKNANANANANANTNHQLKNQSTHANQSKNKKSINKNNEHEYLDFEFHNDIEPCQFQTFKPNSKNNFTVEHNIVANELIYISNDKDLYPIIINYKLLDKYFQRTVFISLVELIDKQQTFPHVWQTIALLIYNFTDNYINIIHINKNNTIYNNHNYHNEHQEFLYRKQDLINTILQITNNK